MTVVLVRTKNLFELLGILHIICFILSFETLLVLASFTSLLEMTICASNPAEEPTYTLILSPTYSCSIAVIEDSSLGHTVLSKVLLLLVLITFILPLLKPKIIRGYLGFRVTSLKTLILSFESAEDSLVEKGTNSNFRDSALPVMI